MRQEQVIENVSYEFASAADGDPHCGHASPPAWDDAASAVSILDVGSRCVAGRARLPEPDGIRRAQSDERRELLSKSRFEISQPPGRIHSPIGRSTALSAGVLCTWRGRSLCGGVT